MWAKKSLYHPIGKHFYSKRKSFLFALIAEHSGCLLDYEEYSLSTECSSINSDIISFQKKSSDISDRMLNFDKIIIHSDNCSSNDNDVDNNNNNSNSNDNNNNDNNGNDNSNNSNDKNNNNNDNNNNNNRNSNNNDIDNNNNDNCNNDSDSNNDINNNNNNYNNNSNTNCNTNNKSSKRNKKEMNSSSCQFLNSCINIQNMFLSKIKGSSEIWEIVLLVAKIHGNQSYEFSRFTSRVGHQFQITEENMEEDMKLGKIGRNNINCTMIKFENNANDINNDYSNNNESNNGCNNNSNNDSNNINYYDNKNNHHHNNYGNNDNNNIVFNYDYAYDEIENNDIEFKKMEYHNSSKLFQSTFFKLQELEEKKCSENLKNRKLEMLVEIDENENNNKDSVNESFDEKIHQKREKIVQIYLRNVLELELEFLRRNILIEVPPYFFQRVPEDVDDFIDNQDDKTLSTFYDINVRENNRNVYKMSLCTVLQIFDADPRIRSEATAKTEVGILEVEGVEGMGQGQILASVDNPSLPLSNKEIFPVSSMLPLSSSSTIPISNSFTLPLPSSSPALPLSYSSPTLSLFSSSPTLPFSSSSLTFPDRQVSIVTGTHVNRTIAENTRRWLEVADGLNDNRLVPLSSCRLLIISTEKALATLHLCQYNSEKALQLLRAELKGSMSRKNIREVERVTTTEGVERMKDTRGTDALVMGFDSEDNSKCDENENRCVGRDNKEGNEEGSKSVDGKLEKQNVMKEEGVMEIEEKQIEEKCNNIPVYEDFKDDVGDWNGREIELFIRAKRR